MTPQAEGRSGRPAPRPEPRAPEAARRLLEATELVDLHIHVGAAVAPHVLWSIAHDQGFKLPVKNYFEFVELVTARAGQRPGLEDYLEIMHPGRRRFRARPRPSSARSTRSSARSTAGSRVTQIELRFNPMKRNLDGERWTWTTSSTPRCAGWTAPCSSTASGPG